LQASGPSKFGAVAAAGSSAAPQKEVLGITRGDFLTLGTATIHVGCGVCVRSRIRAGSCR